MIRLWIILIFVLMSGLLRAECKRPDPDQYISAVGTGITEEEAREQAIYLLITQISSTVSSKTDLMTKDSNTVNETLFLNFIKSNSQLKLKGLNFIICQKAKANKGAEVLAYISKEDLHQSKEAVSQQVNQYLELMEQKKAIGIDYLNEAYIAYLYTFYTPYAISATIAGENISDVQSYLESLLRNYLNQVQISSIGAKRHPDYPEDHVNIELVMSGATDSSINFMLESPAYNSQMLFRNRGGTLSLIMQPYSDTELVKGTLSLRPLSVPGEVKDLVTLINISKEVGIEVDMLDVISIDFTIQEQGELYILSPKIQNLSIRSFEWIVDGKTVSRTEQPRIEKTNKEIILKLNSNNNLTVRKVGRHSGSYFVSAQTHKENKISVANKDGSILHQNVEQNLSRLIAEFNQASAEKRNLDLWGINISPAAKERLLLIWETTPFRCPDIKLEENLIRLSSNSFQMRNIPLILTGKQSGNQKEQGVINLSETGEIADFFFGIDRYQYKSLMAKGTTVTDFQRRQLILDFLENFRTAYNRKDMALLQSTFSDNALIIVGRLVEEKRNSPEMLLSLGKRAELIRYNKQQYLSKLNKVFQLNSYIDVRFEDIEIVKHPGYGDIYGVNLKQRWRSNAYADEGYLFLMIDFESEIHPLVHVRAWQPYKGTRTEEVIELGDFDIVK